LRLHKWTPRHQVLHGFLVCPKLAAGSKEQEALNSTPNVGHELSAMIAELDEQPTCAKFAQVREEVKRSVERKILHYNLDVIISVGYRVNSKRGV